MLNRLLFTRIDNSQLLIFRIFFGILIALECYGAIVTGWVKDTLIDPHFTFTFIGFEWLQPLPGYGMYYYFFVMGTLGIFVALGYKYRLSVISFTILWAIVYLMQKSSYNNHYYLLALISFLMCFFPANTGYSIDARHNPSARKNTMLSYIKWIVILQLFLVYSYASVAKLYGDWLDFRIIEFLMKDKVNYPIIGELLQENWVHKTIATTGIAFDALIVPALLWKPTRKAAFLVSIFFHLFNSIVFQIGIFPYLALAFTVFFFEADTIRNIFFKKKNAVTKPYVKAPSNKKLLLYASGLYFCVQLLLPIRHHFIEDKVLWTEEGHRLSWRMMLRSRTGKIQFKVVKNITGESQIVKLEDHLSKKQMRKIGAYPDFIWQFAQYLRNEHNTNGDEVSVYALNSKVSINGKPYKSFIDPKVDLASEKWSHFGHHNWILPSDKTK
ncbi:HTTM domain-containing protein [Maribacter sp. HTCC2170]|uniref:HTTM domain-containing protein n=1 Tax=Maribacter sp. (strain HTCC2170 / KCCM 42371) TaxID=313603 RepID=UPI00006BD4A7|nr:HTTM domain-containing protein [Maribacter sp. HTCC2170]EAR02455.1 gamma-glutamyl carboxylase-like protein [Maribacter sp. HTCC2170]